MEPSGRKNNSLAKLKIIAIHLLSVIKCESGNWKSGNENRSIWQWSPSLLSSTGH